jgi:putrescine---pyruvate transaminase
MTERSNTANLAEQDRAHHVHPMTNPVALRKSGPEMIMRGEGVYLHLEDGRKVIDAHSNLANVAIGYGNRRVCDAAAKAMETLSYDHTLLGRSNPWAAALSAKLAEITPRQYQYFFFASSGSEANESAIKMALYYWRLKGRPSKRKIISRRGAYHGNTLFATSLTGIETYHKQFGPSVSDLIHHADSTHWYKEANGRSREEFCYDLVQSLERQILALGPETIAAFVGEAIQTGYILPHELYWPEVRRLCDRYEILLIADEIVSGFGKSGKMFGFESFGYEPDLFTMAKGITSGYFPLSSVAVGTQVAEAMQGSNETFAHLFTNSGHPVGAAVALANISVIEEQKLVERAGQEIGPHLARRLPEILEFPVVGEVRHCGVMGALEIDVRKADPTAHPSQNAPLLEKIAALCWQRGAYVRAGCLLCFPMISSIAEIDTVIDILKESIAEATT